MLKFEPLSRALGVTVHLVARLTRMGQLNSLKIESSHVQTNKHSWPDSIFRLLWLSHPSKSGNTYLIDDVDSLLIYS